MHICIIVIQVSTGVYRFLIPEYENLDSTLDQLDGCLDDLEKQNDDIVVQLQELLVENKAATEAFKAERFVPEDVGNDIPEDKSSDSLGAGAAQCTPITTNLAEAYVDSSSTSESPNKVIPPDNCVGDSGSDEVTSSAKDYHTKECSPTDTECKDTE